MIRNRRFSKRTLERGTKAIAILAAVGIIGSASIGTSTVLAQDLVKVQKDVQAAPIIQITSQSFILDGKEVKLPASNVNGSIYIGLRALNEQLSLKSEWDAASHIVTVKGRGRTLTLDLINKTSILNDQVVYGLPAIVQDGSTYVPIRFYLESMGYGISYDVKTHMVEISTIQENAITIQTKKITAIDDHKKLLINYPQIEGMSNQDVQLKINTFLQQAAEAQAKAGQSELDIAAEGIEQAEIETPDNPIRSVDFEASYRVTYNEQNRLSLYEDYYLYTGGAHGNTSRLPYTFDLITGEELTLKDVTAGNANYVPIINAAITGHIQEKGLTMLVPFKSIAPDQAFFLKNNAVVVYFEQYEYTPYSDGMPEFETPFSAFAEK